MIVDMHTDILSRMFNDKSNYEFEKDNECAQIDLPKLIKSKLDLQFWAVYVDKQFKPHLALKKGLQQIELFHKIIEKYSRNLKMVKTTADLEDNKNKVKLLLALEGGEPIEDDLNLLHLFYRLGVRSIGLTWNQRNQIADGVWEDESGGGLTLFGKKLIREMNDLGILVDLAHISKKGFFDAINISTAPVLVTHGNCKSICNHPRNLSDEQIKALAEINGVLGITFYPPFLNDQNHATVDDIVKHIIYVVDLVGIDYVGIGSDFEGIEIFPEGLEDISKIKVLELSLYKYGFSKSEVNKILGLNSMRVIKEVLK
ncbi:MAG TPA: membrane dipeptidase [Clostridia bacterium]|nr:membrane dipeptidase [Clostridia bacterium]